jgi:pyrroline-5-carboxylate reductase
LQTGINPNKVSVTSDNKDAVRNSDILIFAVQPSQMEGILNKVKDLFNENHVIISTITGFKIARIEAILGTGIPIIRAMPNTCYLCRKIDDLPL